MKWLLTTLLFTTLAHAQTVIKNPAYKGKAILAGATQVDRVADIVCQEAGLGKSLRKSSKYNAPATYKLTTLVAKASVLIPVSLGYEIPFETYETLQPNGRCAAMASCRGLDPRELEVGRNGLNTDHPFIKECNKYGVMEKEPWIFAEVTCERSTNGDEISYSYITSGDPVAMGIEHADKEKTCQKFGRAVTGSISSNFGRCDYQYGGQTNFYSYLVFSGRWKLGNQPGPACVQKILKDYGPTVVSEENYDLPPGSVAHMQQSFCVESVSKVKRSNDNNQCDFKVKVRDFMQAPNEIEVSLGSESLEDDNEDRCQALATCFAHETLSCQQANFCPAPGMLKRGKE